MTPALRNAFTNASTRLSVIRRPEPVHQRGVIDLVETRLDVGLQHPVVRLRREVVDLSDRVLRAPVRAGTRRRHGWKSASKIGSSTSFSAACTTRSVTVGMPNARSFPLALGIITCRTGAGVNVRDRSWSRISCRNASTPIPGHDPGHGGPVDPGGARPRVARDAFPRHGQHRRVAHQVVQIIKPAAADPRPPSSAVCSASSVPPRTPGRSSAKRRRRYSPARLRTITVTSCSFRCRPSPGGRLSRPRSTTATPPHRHPSAGNAPIPAQGNGSRRWFPRSLLFGRRARRPALPLRSRRGYAVDLHHDLPGPTHSPSRQFPTAERRLADGHPARLRTALQPGSTGFELVDDQEALRHRFLTCTFPSRSPGPARPVVPDRPDFVAAAPTHPRRSPSAGCRQLHPAATTAKRSKVSHLHPKQQRLVAHDVLIDAEAGDTVEPGRIVCQLRQHRPDAAPHRPPRRPELPSQPVDRGMLGPQLSARPPARPDRQQAPRPADPLVLLGERSAGTDSFAAPPGPFPPQHPNRPTEAGRIDQHHRAPAVRVRPHMSFSVRPDV